MKSPIFLWSFLLACQFVFAQSPEDWTWYNPSILGNYCPDMKFDQEGNLWIISQYRLIRFDGINWVSHDALDSGYTPPYPYGANISAFDFSNDHKIWCSVYGRVLEYDLDQDTWTVHQPSTSQPGPQGLDIKVDPDNGHIWWTTGYGAYEYDGVDWTHPILTYTGPPGEMNFNSYLSLHIDSENTKWITTRSTVCFEGGCFTPAGVIKWSDTEVVFYTGNDLGVPEAGYINLDFDSTGAPVIAASPIFFSNENIQVLTNHNGNWSSPVGIPFEGTVYDMKIAENNDIYLALKQFVLKGIVGSNTWDVIDPGDAKDLYSLEVPPEDGLYITASHDEPGVPSYGKLGYLPPLDYKIRGVLYVDQNANLLYDSSELTLKNRILKTVDGTRMTFSDQFGGYSFLFADTGTYDIQPVLPPYFFYEAPPSGINSVTLTPAVPVVTDAHFGLAPDTTALDVAVTMTPLTNANPGSNVCYLINYKNLTPNDVNVQITCDFDDLLTFQYAVPAPVSQNGNELIFAPPPLGWLEEGSIQVSLSLPPDGGLVGTILSNECSIEPVTGTDLDLSNNTYSLRHWITGSLDPNYIAVSPEGVGPLGKTSKFTPFLEYTIHFQNVGTDTARTVIISNPIDEDLDIYTLNILGASHDFNMAYYGEKRIVQWEFEDIDLVDSLTNEVESNGFIKYTLAPVSQEVGLTLTNSADIYFDYNLPVATNTVLNTLADPFFETPIEAGICPGEVYLFAGDTLTEAGIYYDSLLTAEGYDSVIILTLCLYPVYQTEIEVGICDGGTYNFHGNILWEAGAYIDSSTTIHGCDSITTLNLTVYPAKVDTVEAQICQGDSLDFNGVVLTDAGSYTDTLQTIFGCDSVVTLVMEVLPTLETPLEAEICLADTFDFNGVFLTKGGVYFDSLQSFSGCDSVVVLELAVDPTYQISLEAEIQQGESYEFGGQVLTESGSYTDSLLTTEGCDSVIVMVLTVLPPSSTSDGERDELCTYRITNESGFISLQFPSLGHREIAIFDLNGRRLENMQTEQSEVSIDMHGYADGIYLISVIVEGCALERSCLFVKIQ